MLRCVQRLLLCLLKWFIRWVTTVVKFERETKWQMESMVQERELWETNLVESFWKVYIVKHEEKHFLYCWTVFFTNKRFNFGILKRVTLIILLIDLFLFWWNHIRLINLCCEMEDTFRNWCMLVLKLIFFALLCKLKDLSFKFTHHYHPLCRFITSQSNHQILTKTSSIKSKHFYPTMCKNLAKI